MDTQRRQIPPGRKGLYYLGMALAGVGVLLFLSTFVSAIMHFGDFTDFEKRAKSAGVRAFGGIVMVGLGSALMTIGARGAAGSGVILDPQQARKDVEPWSRMAGGTLKDALDEADINLGKLGGGGSEAAGSDLPFDEKLRRLHQLHQDGILTDEEYEKEKRDILDRN